MVRTKSATNVTGKPGSYKIQPWVDHPAFCACPRCVALPFDERKKPHAFRIKRASAYPDDLIASAQYAREVKRQEEEKLAADGAGWMAARPDAITVAQLAKAYIDAHPKNRREEQILRLHIVPFFMADGGVPVAAQVKAADWRAYQRKRLAAGASPDTVDREWNVGRAMFNFAEEEERLERNPIRRGAIERVGSGEGRKAFFEPEEWRAFVEAFHDEAAFRAHLTRERSAGPVRLVGGRTFGSGKRNPESEASRVQFERLRELQPFFRGLLWSCSRLMELANLRWKDVDLRRGLVTLYQEKTKKPKTLPIVAPWQAELEALQRGLPDAYVYRRSTGSTIGKREAQRAFALMLKISGVERDLVPHSIRHTVLSWLATAGVSQVHRDEIAGHARRAIGDGYAHLTKGSLLPALETLVRIEQHGFTASERAPETRVAGEQQ